MLCECDRPNSPPTADRSQMEAAVLVCKQIICRTGGSFRDYLTETLFRGGSREKRASAHYSPD